MSARFWRMALAISFVAALASTAAAQGYGTVQVPQQKLQDISGKGEFDAMQGNIIKAQINGDNWFIQLDPKAKVKVTGTASPEALMPGMFVKFNGDFDKRGKATAEIKDLEIMTPDDKNPIGATAGGGGGGAFSNPFSADEPKKGPAPKAPAAGPTTLSVVGRISAIKKNSITVACGNMTVKADVASDATVAVNVGSLMFASPMDKVSVKGKYYPSSGPANGAPGKMVATSVDVEMANPLSGPKKKPSRVVPKAAVDKADPAAIDKKTDTKKPAADSKTADDKTADKKTDKKPAADADAKTDKAADGKKPAGDAK